MVSKLGGRKTESARVRKRELGVREMKRGRTGEPES
jgi:hypothetical protein